MRRKSEKEVRKEYRVFLFWGIGAVLFGLFILLYPVLPKTPLEEYKEKEVVIRNFDCYLIRGSSYYYIVTEENERYDVTGDFRYNELSERLVKGTVAVIKYDANDVLPFKKYAEEITVDGNKIVTYNDDAPTNWIPHIVFALLSWLVGAGCLFAYRRQIVQNRNMQAKRDARILKKYGNLKK